ncbi:MAG: GDYXXLXY domain-containing protein [Carboxylicivirga sp.]|jgi:uncharacterized membrane-anchored protein|nr:GDYXXLXY domain-containing protein [Carboxylicivirga sp.]
MKKRKIIIAAFILVVLAQLFVPAQMIWNREQVLSKGQEFKFQTRPIDPNDPFRGKYVRLRIEENTFTANDKSYWQEGEEVYVTLINDEAGFIKIAGVSKYEPQNQAYVKGKIDDIPYGNSYTIRLKYPFDRYYMEESKADDAEKIHRDSARDTINLTYALVSILDGEAVLKDVMINEQSIREIVKNRQLNNANQ